MSRASDLLERFVEMYGEVALTPTMIQSDPNLWYDYYKHSGQHMILTDEGWEPGDALEIIYMKQLNGEDISDIVHAEVNWYQGDRKYPRIFPRKRLAKTA
jgi:hypothetical protein